MSTASGRSPLRGWIGRAAAALALALAGAIAAPNGAAAQSYASFLREANANTIKIVAGGPGGTALAAAHDLATVLQCVDGLRIVPIAGQGDVGNVYDLLFLRGVDMAIVQADVLEHADREALYTRDLKERIVYLAPLFQEEVHLIADSSIQRIEDLQGKFVNVGPPGALALAARNALAAAGVTPIISQLDDKLALERVIDGGLDAMFVVAGKPAPMLNELASVPNLRLVPLQAPQGDAYAPATVTHGDYPTLVRAGETVDTFAVSTVLAVYNWPTDRPQFAKSERFTKAFFKRLSYLRRPARHPKWAETRLTAALPGWTRFQPAQDRVDLIIAERGAPEPIPAAPAAAAAATGPSDAALEAMFQKQLDEFNIVPPTAEEREQLFLAFRRRFEATQQ